MNTEEENMENTIKQKKGLHKRQKTHINFNNLKKLKINTKEESNINDQSNNSCLITDDKVKFLIFYF